MIFQETVMWMDYAKLIRESEPELGDLEKRLSGRPTANRVKMLRLLKSRSVRSRRVLATVLGYSQRQLQRWWNLYQRGGIEALLEEKPRGGSTKRITPRAWAALEEEIKAGRIARLKDAQVYLSKHFGIEYKGVSGLSRLLKRRYHQRLLR